MGDLVLEKEALEREIQEESKVVSANDGRINAIRTKYVNNCKERIAIANTVDTERLGELEIEDRKSEAHELFKWVIITFYKEPTNKYYWNNFSVGLY